MKPPSEPTRREEGAAPELLAGLRYVVPPYKRPAKSAGEREMVARDLGFRDEAAHQRWRKRRAIVGSPLRRKP